MPVLDSDQHGEKCIVYSIATVIVSVCNFCSKLMLETLSKFLNLSTVKTPKVFYLISLPLIVKLKFASMYMLFAFFIPTKKEATSGYRYFALFFRLSKLLVSIDK